MADICIDLFSELFRMIATAAAGFTSGTVRNSNPSSIGNNVNPNFMVSPEGESDSTVL